MRTPLRLNGLSGSKPEHAEVAGRDIFRGIKEALRGKPVRVSRRFLASNLRR